MKLGTHIRLKDGREATVVYNSLIGVGAKLGLHNPDPKEFEGTTGNTFAENVDENWEWEPDVLLREPWAGCERNGFTKAQCVGNDFEVLTPQEDR